MCCHIGLGWWRGSRGISPRAVLRPRCQPTLRHGPSLLPGPPSLQAAWTLSSYVAISYCNTSSIAGWNCTRCDGIAAGFTPERVRGAPA